MLQVTDVAAASRWYQDVAGFVSGHGGDEFEMLFGGEPYASPRGTRSRTTTSSPSATSTGTCWRSTPRSPQRRRDSGVVTAAS